MSKDTKGDKKNGKNGNTGSYEVGYKKPPKHTQFTSKNQPSGEAKSIGKQKKKGIKELQEQIIEVFVKYSLSSIEEIKELKNTIQNGGEILDENGDKIEINMIEVKILRYLASKKTDTDFINRALQYAKQEIELTTKENPYDSVDLETKKKMLELYRNAKDKKT